MITLRPSVEAVREFKIQTNMFAAEQGRNAGATVNVITKNGTNEFHGSAYEFLRNDKFDAREFFAPAGQAKPAYRQNQFGASLGGPIIKNKVFFFTNYEGFTKRRENVSVNTVPTEAMRRGDFSAVRDIYDPFSVRRTRPTPAAISVTHFPTVSTAEPLGSCCCETHQRLSAAAASRLGQQPHQHSQREADVEPGRRSR